MKKLLAVLLLLTLVGACACAAADDPFTGMLTYDEGQYRVGRDMLSGEYVLLSTSNYGSYFAVTSDALGDDILFNDIFDTNSIITVEYGEYVKLQRCIAIRADDFYSRYTIKSSNPGVMLRVGYDVEPGEHRLRAQSGETGYYCIYNDSRHDDIIANDLFENSAYVTLRWGQYIILDRCTMVY